MSFPPTPFSVQAIYAYTPQSSIEQKLEVGKIYNVTNIWFCTDGPNGPLWFPSSYTRLQSDPAQISPSISPPSAPTGPSVALPEYDIKTEYPFLVQAISSFAATRENEFSIEVGNTYSVILANSDGWYQTCVDGKYGWFPANHVVKVKSSSKSKKDKDKSLSSSSKSSTGLVTLKSGLSKSEKTLKSPRSSRSTSSSPSLSTSDKKKNKTLKTKLGFSSTSNGSIKQKTVSEKVVSELSKQTGLDKKIIVPIYDTVFKDEKENFRTDITVDIFTKHFEGKLGPISVLRKLFSIFTAEAGSGKVLDDKEFFRMIAALHPKCKKKDDKARASLVFKMYDDDGSAALESNELTIFLNHFKSIAISEGKSTIEAEKLIKQIKEKLDDSKEGTVPFSKFVEISLSSNLLSTLLPSSAFSFDKERKSKFAATDVHMTSETDELFTLLKSNYTEDAPTLEKITQLIQNPKLENNATDINGYTLLHYSVTSNKIKSTTLLLESGLDPNLKYQNGVTALHFAVRLGLTEMTKLLLDKKAQVNIQDDSGWTPLHLAVKADSEQFGGGLNEVVQELINRGANLAIEDNEKCTVLDLAARYGQHEHFGLLIKHGSDPKHTSKNDYTALHWAANTNFATSTSIKKLVSLGVPVNAKAASGITAMHLAASNGKLNCLEQLFQASAEIVATDNLGRTPLHMAAQQGNPRCVTFLIKEGPKALKMKDSQGRTPGDIARQKGNSEALSIIDAGPLQEQSKWTQQLLACFRNGENDTVKQMLKKKDADVNAANQNGTTLLHYASMQGRSDILELLLERKADPNIGNNRATTPLHKAPQRGQLKCLQMLLAAGANVNCQDEDDITPLHRTLNELGMQKKNSEKANNIAACVTELLKRGSKLNLSDHEGLYVLDVASRYGLVAQVKEMIDLGADIHHVCHCGWTPLHWAAAGGHTDVVKLLIANGAQANQTTKDKNGVEVDLPTHIAFANNYSDTVKSLVELGANLETTTPQLNQTNLHLAALVGNLQLVKYLVEEKGLKQQIEAKDKFGNTPLHLAQLGEVINYLISAGASITSLNLNGETPFMCAAKWGSENAVSTWLSKQLNFNLKNKAGFTALYLSAYGGHEQTAMLIMKAKNCDFEYQVSNDQIKYTKEPNALYPCVTAGSIQGLVVHAASPYYFDRKFVQNLLLGYRKFTKSTDLFDMLMKQYKPPQQDHTTPWYSLTTLKKPVEKADIKEKKPKSSDEATDDKPTDAGEGSPVAKKSENNGPDEQKSERRRRIVQEMLQTEETYVKSLNQLHETWEKPLRVAVELDKPIISKEEIDSIFSNVQAIHLLHEHILKALQERIQNWNDTKKIGDVFIQNAPVLKLYVKYINNYDSSINTIKNTLKTSKPFSNFLQGIVGSTDTYQLSSLLIQPVQRIPRYEMLINDLLRNSWDSHPDIEDLKTALSKIKEVAQYINQQKKMFESTGLQTKKKSATEKNLLSKGSSTSMSEVDGSISLSNEPNIPPGTCAVIYYWLKHYFIDFSGNAQLVSKLYAELFQRKDLGNLAKDFEMLYTEQMEEACNVNSLSLASIYTGAVVAPDHSFLTHNDPRLIAEQLTVIEESNFKQIDFREWQGQGWQNKKEAEKKVPTILHAFRHSIKIQSWVVTEISAAASKSKRTELIKLFVTIARYCYEMHNFNSVYSIVAGLKFISKHVPIPEDHDAIFRGLVSNLAEKNYRRALTNVLGRASAIPALELHLQDLEALEKANDDYRAPKLLNFDKMTKYGDIVRSLLQLQQFSYGFQPSGTVLKYIFNVSVLSETEAATRLKSD
eukprot:TRINITY_DN4061_c0_g1_i1.p1 TRINITY_DN4061_c0_g1~~TRINITY_DN4061_c0_g1_i1.p1  ORF type:complete len:1793 (+),score=446.36 TRINITY_DN4061_c0_g1_i1:61-5439(+)